MENFTDKLREIRDKFHPDKVRKIKSLRDVKSPRLRKLIFGLCILLSTFVYRTILPQPRRSKSSRIPRYLREKGIERNKSCQLECSEEILRTKMVRLEFIPTKQRKDFIL